MSYVKDIVNYFGFESCDNYLCDNKAYNQCREILCDTTINLKALQENTKKVRISKLKKEVYHKSYFLLENVDLSVNCMNFNDFKVYIKNRDISLLEKKKKSIDVFKVPVSYDDANLTNYLIDVEMKSMPILAESISLNRCIQKNNLVLQSSYIHEIGHLLIQRKKKTIKNYVHMEFIPIMLELLYFYFNDEEEVLSANIIERLFHFQKSLSIDYISSHLYDISALLAFQTIEKYIDFNNQQKNEMLSRLKDCLNCDIQVETFMEDYGIGFNDTESSVKSFRKTMERVGIK